MTTATTPMTTAEVANQLVTLCKNNQFREAMETLYAENITSLEGCEMGGQPRETKGKDNVRKKTDWWEANHTIHSVTTDGPYLAVDKFAVTFSIDVTFKPANKRTQGSEVAVYTVQNGKIIHEEFLGKK